MSAHINHPQRKDTCSFERNRNRRHAQGTGIFLFIVGLIIIWTTVSISNHTLTHEIFGNDVSHWIESIGIMIGLGASAIGIGYFAIQKRYENQDRKTEYRIFKIDLTQELLDMTKLLEKYGLLSWNEQKLERDGNLTSLAFDTFILFNNKYRHLFDKKIRNAIGGLNIAISLFNDSVIKLHELENEMIFQNKSHDRQMKASIGHYNTQLIRIVELSKEINDIIESQPNKNWLKRIFKKY